MSVKQVHLQYHANLEISLAFRTALVFSSTPEDTAHWSGKEAHLHCGSLELLQIAAAAGLNVEEARSQMLFPGTTGIINQDRADVEAMGVKGTPTFFVNGIRLDPFGEDELRALVAKEIKASGGS